MKKILYVVNPASGRRKFQDLYFHEKEMSKTNQWKSRFYKTTGKHDRDAIQKEIRMFNPCRVAVFGGDGTLNLVASLLIDTDIAMAILPGGSANGLAKNLEIPESIPESIKIALSGDTKEIDVIITSSGRICLHLCDAGLNARIVKRFEEQGERGLIGYGKQLIRELLSGSPSFRFTANINNKIISKRAEMIIITNTKRFGTGALISPQSCMNDGIFEFLIIKPYTWKIILDYFHLLATRRKDRMNFVEIYRGNKLKIHFKRETDMQVDGEILECVSQISFSIKKKALRVIVPFAD